MNQFRQAALVNLNDLRQQLANRLAFLMIGLCALAMLENMMRRIIPAAEFITLAALFGAWLYARGLLPTHPTLARWGIVGLLLLTLLHGLWFNPDPHLPFLGLLLIFAAGLLIPAGEFLTALLLTALMLGWTQSGARAYPLPVLLGSQVLAVGLARLITYTLYTALEWAWNSELHANELLEQTRAHRAQLSQTLKSLELAYSLQWRLQNELITARKEAEQARQLKGRFAANISHELRTPLNLILGFADVLCFTPEVYGEFKWPAKLRRDLHQIYRNSKHLLSLIDDILDLSRYEVLDFSQHTEPIRLEELFQNAAEIAGELFQTEAVRLEVRLAPDLPTVEGDRTRLRQVLINLLSNARRFTQTGWVRLEARRQADEILISVTDTGVSIPADKLPFIFDEFYQVDLSIRREHQGFGLGLAICRRFIEAHHGRIWAESEAGRGTTIYFTLPIVTPLNLEPPHPKEGYLPPTPDRQRACLLVVDPDPAVAAYVQRNLNAQDIIAILQPEKLRDEIFLHHPRLVIWNSGSGTSPDPAIVSALPVPFISCTLPSQAVAAARLGVRTVLTQPVTPEQIRGEVEKLSDRQRILIMGDNLDFVQLMQRALEASPAGFSLHATTAKTEALEWLRQLPFDLILLELAKVEEEEELFLTRLRQEAGARVPEIILLTATEPQVFRQAPNRLLVEQSAGLNPYEVLQCLQALAGILRPRYDELSQPRTIAA